MNIIIVDQSDKEIGVKDITETTTEDIYRVSALWITNSQGEVLLARRHRNKKKHPNMWGPAVAGTVEQGESYEQNIIKETKEEIGLEDVAFVIGPKTETTGEFHHFTQWFTLQIDKEAKDFVIQEDEVEEVQWFKVGELKKKMQESSEKFLPTLPEYVKLFHD